MACYLARPLCLWMALLVSMQKSLLCQVNYVKFYTSFLTAAVIQRFRLDEANGLVFWLAHCHLLCHHNITPYLIKRLRDSTNQNALFDQSSASAAFGFACVAGGRGGWQRGLEPSLHDRPSWEIRPSETEYKFSLKTNMAENAEMEERLIFARF